MALAERLGFTPSRAAEVGIVVSELATNQVRHAGGGAVLLRACRRVDEVDAVEVTSDESDEGGLEVIAVDSGPGLGDVTEALRDGHSTAGTLGIGLGAVDRLSSSWTVLSDSRGTVLVASFGTDGVTTVGAPGARLAVGALSRPITGEDVCGDGYAVRVDGGVVSALLVDGLGHGPLAATAAATAVRAFRAAPPSGPAALLTAVHRGLAGTRGAAAAVVQDAGAVADGELRYAGIGNISAHVSDAAGHRRLISYPGIAGGQARTVREVGCPVALPAVVVLHSDGVTDKLQLPPAGTLAGRSPVAVAAAVLRDVGVRHDDASVLVLTRADPSWTW
jgi:anti-sigma regulatory factor (Ser/Thr protein kinase)